MLPVLCSSRRRKKYGTDTSHNEGLKRKRDKVWQKRPEGHVTAAVSCLEMALRSTLWMADQVSLMASGGIIGISHEVANEFPGMWARPTRG